ncbi:MAG: glycosyltransferase, partial [Desulfomonilaceae bacterium]
MIRVGFILAYQSASWLGGVNYFRNLLDAILSLPDRKIAPVVFLRKARDFELTDFDGIEVIRSSLFDQFHPAWVIRKGVHSILKNDFLLEKFLTRHKVDVLSHSGYLGPSSAIPAIGWIPDFQHVRRPDFFSPKTIQFRTHHFKALCDYCQRIVLSSKDALGDLQAFSPEAEAKSIVLNFVSCLTGVTKIPDRKSLEKRYNFRGTYFHVPNQFWVHKNHRVLIEALGLLKQEDQNMLMLATGSTFDSQCGNHTESLVALAKQMGVDKQFRILGTIPYLDMIGLMAHSAAVINPSLFEGWSTSVEEARSLGKQIILSDIPVHREQNPPRSWFFAPTDAQSLTQIM